MLHKRDYNAIAKIIDNLTVNRLVHQRDILYRDELVECLAEFFARDNPRFDGERFKAACWKKMSIDDRNVLVMDGSANEERGIVAG
jgi:hypothetical protein